MKKTLIAFLLLALLVGFFGREIRRATLSALIMVDLLRPGKSPLLRFATPQPSVQLVHYPGGGRRMEADLYLPRKSWLPGGTQGAHPGIILVHGVNEVGKADLRIKWAAEMLCRAGFVVLVPDFSGFKSLQLRPSDIGEIADSFLYLTSRKDRVRPDRCGIAGFSYGSGPTLIASCDPRIRHQVSFLVSFGGYYDLEHIVQFVTTGYYAYGGTSYHRPPNDYSRWIFLHYNLDLLAHEGDRRALREVEGRIKRGQFDERSLIRRLSPEGQAVFRLVANRDPQRTAELLSRMPSRIRSYIAALSPSRFVKDLKAYLFIVHGVPDDFVPHTESLCLYDALPDQSRAHLVLLRIFSHVRPSFPRPTPSNILFVYLPEGAKFYALIYDLLQRTS